MKNTAPTTSASTIGSPIPIAASDSRLAGAVAQCPLVDGLAGATLIRPSRSIRLMSVAVADRIGSLFGRAPIYLPISVAPGQWGVSDTPDALFGKEMVVPQERVDWNNRLAARSLLSISTHRPVRRAASIRIPILLIVAETDTGSGSTRSTGGRTSAARRIAPQQGRPLRRVPGWRRL